MLSEGIENMLHFTWTHQRLHPLMHFLKFCSFIYQHCWAVFSLWIIMRHEHLEAYQWCFLCGVTFSAGSRNHIAPKQALAQERIRLEHGICYHWWTAHIDDNKWCFLFSVSWWPLQYNNLNNRCFVPRTEVWRKVSPASNWVSLKCWQSYEAAGKAVSSSFQSL